MVKLHMSVGRSALALSLAFCATPALAKSADAGKPADPPAAAATDTPQGTPAPAAADDKGGPDIIITATKRAENVQNVPLAVSVISPDTLKASGVNQFADLGKIAPSLTIRPAEHPVNSNVSLRGVGTFAFGIGVESSVAVLVDEVPLAFSARAFTDLPDVQRIEVLRGPQSTLYGKSASAGLINIITAQPTDTFKAKFNLLATTDSEYGGNFSLSGPLSDKVGYVWSTSYSKWDGNVRNLFNGKKVNGREAFTTRGKLRFDLGGDSTMTLSANYVNGNTSVGRPFIRLDPTALLRNTAGQTQAVTMPGVVIGPENTNISNNYDARTRYYGYGGYVRFDIGLGGGLNLVSLSSYDKFKLYDYLDHDDTSSSAAVGNNIQVGQFRSRLLTQEFRLLSPSDKPFRYTLGAYYANVQFSRPFMRGPAFSLANWYATSKDEQIAGFVQLDWEIVPHLKLSAGGRIQNEKVSYSFQDNLAAVGSQFFSGSASDTAGTYKLNATYQLTPDVMFFATYATGYKGQTYDLTTGFNANRAAAGPIKPERSRDKEFGIRTQFLDRKVTLNITYFDTNYKDLQAQTIETLADGTSNFRLTNVGGLNTKGIEIDSSLRAGDLTLTGSAAYLDAKYTSYARGQCYPLQTVAQGCVAAVPAAPPVPAQPAYQNLTGARAIQAPEWKFSLALDYTPSLGGNLKGIVQANYQYQSSVYYVAEDPQTFQPAYGILNAGLGVRDADKKWEVVLFVNNVFDVQYYPSLVNSAGNFGNKIATQAVLPRDFRRYGGIRLGLNF